MAKIPPEKLVQIEQDYSKALFDLWYGKQEVPLEDPRFQSNPWHQGMYSYLYQTYLINAKHLMELANAVEADIKVKNRILFATEQVISSMAPSNFLATNPEAIEELIQSNGQSLTNGIKNFLADVQEGKISQTNSTAFELGKNIATTKGAVVFQNDLIQLIQYSPLTAQVYERPFLLVPPCINKYYILDLQEQNSFVQYMISEGFTVFIVSWKNPDQRMAHLTWDDYVGTGVIEAIRACVEISQQPKVNLLGFCVGGTLVATALAILAAKGIEPVASVVLLTSFLDFSDTGQMDVFVDEQVVEMREKTIGGKGGNYSLFSGVDLANTFSFLRPNDLVWNYVVSNYLMGKTPSSFDLLYWNGDSTNLPGPMYTYFLRHMYLNNELKVPNRLEVCGTPLDLSKISCPSFIYASREDHIVPWKTAYESVNILRGNRRFVLGASGHIAGVINPPQKKKRNYWVNNKTPQNAIEWFEGAKSVEGSWWPELVSWLAPLSGKQVRSKKVLGNTKYPVIEEAPGSYVREKAEKV
jgi:polyhydroxyalkanoate synthase